MSSKPRSSNTPPTCALRTFKRSTTLSDWPASPQANSGQLAASNSGWRTQWPQIDLEACNACGLCVLYCPDGALVWDARHLPVASADWCKGCGICARECPKDLIRMLPQESS